MRPAIFILSLVAFTGLAAAQDSNFANGPQYLITGLPLLARSIATPSLSLGEAAPASAAAEAESGAGVQLSTSASTQTPSNLYPIYYGQPKTAETVVVEASTTPSEPLPPRVVGFDSGVSGFADGPSLRAEGYGVGMADLAQAAKAGKSPSPRLYTNRDIDRLHGN